MCVSLCLATRTSISACLSYSNQLYTPSVYLYISIQLAYLLCFQKVFTWAKQNKAEGTIFILRASYACVQLVGESIQSGMLKLAFQNWKAREELQGVIWREVHVVLEVKLFDNNSHCHPIKALRKLLDWHASDSPSLRVTTISVALLGLKGLP